MCENCYELTKYFSLYYILGERIQCYCNNEGCKENGYTCHSDIGRCYYQLSYETTDNTKSLHGCAESLPYRDRTMCESEGDFLKTKNGADEEWPLLMCCKSDMCNYQEGLDINIYVDTNANGSIQKGQCFKVFIVLIYFKLLKSKSTTFSPLLH